METTINKRFKLKFWRKKDGNYNYEATINCDTLDELEGLIDETKDKVEKKLGIKDEKQRNKRKR